MKNTLFKKVLAVALACTMTFSMATVTHAADAKEITIGVTSFADTLEPTEQYFSWVVSRYAMSALLNSMKKVRSFLVWQKAGRTAKTEKHGHSRFVKALNSPTVMI